MTEMEVDELVKEEEPSKVEVTNIKFFCPSYDLTKQVTLKRFVKLPENDSKMIKKLMDEGFSPEISAGKCPAFAKELLGWALLEGELNLRCDWENIDHEKIICLIYWQYIDIEAFDLAKDYFEDLMGLSETKRDISEFKAKMLEKKPYNARPLGGSLVVKDDGNELPDGRKVIAMVEGGDLEELVNDRISQIKSCVGDQSLKRPFEESPPQKQIKSV